MVRQHTPYNRHNTAADRVAADPEERDVVIIDGRAMTYRSYRRWRDEKNVAE
ncbi:hypothetical protein ACNS7O_11560 [Haloferacaceae archaeon DSL9]